MAAMGNFSLSLCLVAVANEPLECHTYFCMEIDRKDTNTFYVLVYTRITVSPSINPNAARMRLSDGLYVNINACRIHVRVLR